MKVIHKILHCVRVTRSEGKRQFSLQNKFFSQFFREKGDILHSVSFENSLNKNRGRSKGTMKQGELYFFK